MAGISEREKQLARGAWKHVEQDYATAGHVLFKELFAAHPDYIKYFDKMKTSPNEDLFESPRFQKHMVSSLLPEISQMMNNLDNPDQLVAQLKQIGVNHKKRRLNRGHFEALQKTVVVTFKKLLADQFTPDAEAAWNKVFSLVVDKISAEL